MGCCFYLPEAQFILLGTSILRRPINLHYLIFFFIQSEMRKRQEIILSSLCAGWLIVLSTRVKADTEKPKFTRQNAIEEYGSVDPFEQIKGVLDKPVLDQLNNQFEKYLESADSGSVKSGSQQIMAVSIPLLILYHQDNI